MSADQEFNPEQKQTDADGTAPGTEQTDTDTNADGKVDGGDNQK